MTQHVFDNAMTAHVWAAQTQHTGRSHNGNLYFEGRTLFSYGSHFPLAYACPFADVFILNTEDSSITTNGKHRPAAYRAIGYGNPCRADIDGLGCVARYFDSFDYAVTRAGETQAAAKAELQARLLAHFARLAKAGASHDTAAEDSLCLILQGAGMAQGKARIKARTMTARSRKAAAKAEAKEARDKAAKEARAAKYYAGNMTPAEVAKETRDTLAEAAAASRYWQAEKEKEARDNLKEYFRAAKAAKGKGWTQIAAACRALYQAGRAEIRQYEENAARWQYRASIASHIATIKQTPAEMNRAGRAEMKTAAQTAARYNALARLLDSLCDSLQTVGASPFAGRKAGFTKAAGQAAELRDIYSRKAGAAQQEAQAEARAAWLAGGPQPYGMGRLVCPEGGSLLRAENVTRDESGQITGGQLRTSWGASVPLVEAIRAFRFLKLVRAKGQGWQANGQRIRVGHFQVERIDPRGNFKAACHDIKWQQCAALAESLGLADIAADDSAIMTKGAAV